jgi:hypothetical protein
MSEAATNKIKRRFRYGVWLNLIGMGTYLYFASKLWPQPEDAGTDLAGNPIVWGLTVFTVFAVCSLINIVWLTLIVLDGRKGKGWRSMRPWLLVIVAWVLVYRFDFYNINHGSTLITGNASSTLAHTEKSKNEN